MIKKKIYVAGALLSLLGQFAGVVDASAAPSSKTFVVDATGQGVAGGMGIATAGYAKGTFTVNTSTNKICYRIIDHGLGIVQAAHIHAGKKGIDGGVVVTLNVKSFNATSKSQACVKVTGAVAKSVFKFPSAFYFNVHTKAYPNGAVRAQL
jgi:hypothetical protein